MMKLKLYTSILLFCLVTSLSAQSFVLSGQIGTFKHAGSFSINSLGYIFVTDISTNEIVKMDSLGNIVKFIGGFGWKESSFDYPADIFANELNVYVADKNNNRIQLFDKDLNFLSELSAQNYDDERIKFRYPTGVAVSSQGDLVLLDSDNKRLLKFNLRGEFQVSIGSYDSGTFALANPKQFIITNDFKIIIIDSKNLVIFDQFGNPIRKIQLQFEPDNINSSYQAVCVNNSKQILIMRNANNFYDPTEQILFTPEIDEAIIGASVFNSRLFVLTKENILIYKIIYQ